MFLYVSSAEVREGCERLKENILLTVYLLPYFNLGAIGCFTYSVASTERKKMVIKYHFSEPDKNNQMHMKLRENLLSSI